MPKCKKCGHSQESGNFCEDCGFKLKPEEPVCNSCKAKVKENATFCPECGNRVKEEFSL
jgi:predicted amidophosphoribosyltransferase